MPGQFKHNLTPEQREELIQRRLRGERPIALAREYGVGYSAVKHLLTDHRIRSGKVDTAPDINDPRTREWMTLVQAAAFLQTDLQNVRNWVKLNRITACCFLHGLPGESYLRRSAYYVLRTDIERLATPAEPVESAAWVTMEEAAVLLGVNYMSVRCRVRRGKLPFVEVKRIGHHLDPRYYLRRADIEAIANRPRKPQPAFERHATDCELTHLGCLIDTEGCITINMRQVAGQNPVYQLVIMVANTHRGILEVTQQRFGGDIRTQYRGDMGQKTCYTWRVSNNTAAHLLRLCLPYLIIKREQAKIGIALQEHVRAVDAGVWRSLSAVDLNYRAGLKQRIHELNRRGLVP